MFTEKELDELSNSAAYAEYIGEHSTRSIGSGDALLDAMESGYLWEDFLESLDSV
jgi:hypothetical protein